MKLFSFGKKSRTPAEFWSWFVAHQQDYAAGQPSSSAIHALGEAINSVHNGLAWGISLGGDDRTPTLEISADGIRDHIRPVLQLVRSAPPIPGWNVVAFRQPMSDMALAIGDEKIDQDSVLVATKSAGPGVLDVALFLPLPSMVPKEDYTKIGFLMLDHAVGEYRVMTQIGTVQFCISRWRHQDLVCCDSCSPSSKRLNQSFRPNFDSSSPSLVGTCVQNST